MRLRQETPAPRRAYRFFGFDISSPKLTATRGMRPRTHVKSFALITAKNNTASNLQKHPAGVAFVLIVTRKTMNLPAPTAPRPNSTPASTASSTSPTILKGAYGTVTAPRATFGDVRCGGQLTVTTACSLLMENDAFSGGLLLRSADTFGRENEGPSSLCSAHG